MRKILYIWAALMCFCLHVTRAEDVTFTASAPGTVAMGEQFRLAYTISSTKIRDFKAPSIKNFDVLMGPSRSQQSSTQIVNGRTTSTSSVTYTYILMAQTEGEFTIPGTTAMVDGREVLSNSVKIKVIPADSSSGSAGGSGQGGAGASDAQSIAADDLFVNCTTSKTQAYEQEAILLTYKIYTAVDLRGFDNVKLPDFKGFQSQEVELPNDRKWELEHYRGRNYRTTVYRQFLLFPQQVGEQVIDGSRFDASIIKATNIDPFESFFNGGASHVEIKKALTTPRVKITVKALPKGKPGSFSGGVGEFAMQSSISHTELKANDAVTLKIVVSGVGNLKLMSPPKVKFPEEFEVYDPKVSNQSQLVSNGVSGSQTFEYIAIPRSAGDYKIPAVEFSYFDVKSGAYKTLSSDEYRLHITKDTAQTPGQVVSNYNKEELRILNEDIHFIKQNPVTLRERGSYFFGSLGYVLTYLVLSAVFAVFFAVYRKRLIDSGNEVKTKNKKANKMAVRRLKAASKLMEQGNKDGFFDEVLRAMWGYMSDKLNIPVSQLSKDNVEEKLQQRGVGQELIGEVLQVLNECEFERFAPGDANSGMSRVYGTALETIIRLESSINKTVKKTSTES